MHLYVIQAHTALFFHIYHIGKYILSAKYFAVFPPSQSKYKTQKSLITTRKKKVFCQSKYKFMLVRHGNVNPMDFCDFGVITILREVHI